MTVSIFPAPASFVGDVPVWIKLQNTSATTYFADIPKGIYRVSSYNQTLGATINTTFVFKNASGGTVVTATTVDSDSGNTNNQAEALVIIPNDTVKSVDMTAASTGVIAKIEKLNWAAGNYASLTQYNSSQNITLSATSQVLLLGGGANGNGGGWAGGSGGGSGYINVITVPAGTYPLVVGGAGGTTTLNGSSAAGGSGGTGGSGGGNGGGDRYTPGGGGGSNGGGGGAGAGSGVSLPSWAPASVGGAGGGPGYFSQGGPGSGGGFYGGGGGAGGSGDYWGGGGGSAAAGTGGGGGGGSAGAGGGAGGSGCAIVLAYLQTM